MDGDVDRLVRQRGPDLRDGGVALGGIDLAGEAADGGIDLRIGVACGVPAAFAARARLVEEREDVVGVVRRYAPAEQVELRLRRVFLDQREVRAFWLRRQVRLDA